MPLVKPVTVIGEAEPVAVMLPGVDIARYVTAPPLPVYAGAVKATVACAFPPVAVPMVGVPGVAPPLIATIAANILSRKVS